MVKLTDEQKDYITNKFINCNTLIYYIEQRCKACVEGMPIDELIDWGLVMMEEQAFHKDDDNYEYGDKDEEE